MPTTTKTKKSVKRIIFIANQPDDHIVLEHNCKSDKSANNWLDFGLHLLSDDIIQPGGKYEMHCDVNFWILKASIKIRHAV